MQNNKPGEDSPPDSDRVEIKSAEDPLGFLFKGLQEANRLFVEGKDAGRVGVIEALNTVVQFLLVFEGTTNLRQPLLALLNALVSLNEGQVLPLLEPQSRSGRAPASAARANDMAMAALIVHRLHEAGFEMNEAYKQVAQVFRDAGVKSARGQNPQVTARTVRGWCEKIAEDVGCQSEAAKAFERLKQSKTRGAIAIRQATPQALLDSLRRSLAEMRASEH
jgi:hypothetical protein